MIPIKVEVLVSTMFNDNQLHKKMNIDSMATIVNQTDFEGVSEITDSENCIRYINTLTRGLSTSRNLAIHYSQGDICIFADDDVTYIDGYADVVAQAYQENPDADIIAFRVDSTTDGYSLNRLKEGPVNRVYSMRIASVQITFKKESIIEHNLFLESDFGSGSNKYLNGEENIFLYKAIKKGLKVKYVDSKIADVSFETSTWRGNNEELEIITKGAMFYEMSKYLYPTYNIQFALRKRNEYTEYNNFIKMTKLLFYGAKQRKKDKCQSVDK